MSSSMHTLLLQGIVKSGKIVLNACPQSCPPPPSDEQIRPRKREFENLSDKISADSVNDSREYQKEMGSSCFSRKPEV